MASSPLSFTGSWIIRDVPTTARYAYLQLDDMAPLTFSVLASTPELSFVSCIGLASLSAVDGKSEGDRVGDGEMERMGGVAPAIAF